jgi:hypothetical protein
MLVRKSVCTKPNTAEPRRSEVHQRKILLVFHAGLTEKIYQSAGGFEELRSRDSVFRDRHVYEGLSKLQRKSEAATHITQLTLIVVKSAMICMLALLICRKERACRNEVMV